MELPRKMQAAILVEQKQPLIVDEVQLPPSLAAGQVLVKLANSGICGSQIGEIDGVKGLDRFLPHLLGHEGSGTVVATGDAVQFVKPGNKVVLHWRKGNGINAQPPKYRWQGKTVNAGWVTTFNEYAIVSENRLTPVPHDLAPGLAALFGCAITTGFGVVQNNARLKIGESVVVYGAGGVGLSIIQAASMVSAYPIIGVDLHDNRLGLAHNMGATHMINASKEDAGAAIQSILDNRPLDVFIDNTGNSSIIELGYEITSPQGRIVLVGVPDSADNIALHSLPLHFGKKIVGSHGGEAEPALDIPRYSRLVAKGRFELSGMISKTYPLSAINDALDDMRNGRLAGRCLIDFE